MMERSQTDFGGKGQNNCTILPVKYQIRIAASHCFDGQARLPSAAARPSLPMTVLQFYVEAVCNENIVVVLKPSG
jgi:hypothetical protein